MLTIRNPAHFPPFRFDSPKTGNPRQALVILRGPGYIPTMEKRACSLSPSWSGSKRSCGPGIRILAVALVLLLASGCASRPLRGHVAELITLPQDLTAYLDSTGAHQRLMEPQRQDRMARDFLAAFFSPWSRSGPSFAATEFSPYLRQASSGRVFGENTLPRPPDWGRELQDNAALDQFPNLGARALAVNHSSLRLLPSMAPMFKDFQLPGQGYPFDLAQNSAVWAGTPLLVSHMTRDNAWALVETWYAKGWMPVDDLGFVNPDQVQRYRNGVFVSVVQDRIPIRGCLSLVPDSARPDSPLFLQYARIGMILPAWPGAAVPGSPDAPQGMPQDAPQSTPSNAPWNSRLDPVPSSPWTLMVPRRLPDGRAVFLPGTLPAASAALFPLELSTWNLAVVGNQMMGQPYGWGGLFRNRDCSSTLQDLFAAFGLALPRNSRAQAEAGRFVNLDGLHPAEKLARLRTAPPLTTLVYKPGHIMLLAGTWQGRPLIFHNMWGLRSTAMSGPTPGRIVLGRTVVTSLLPGREHPDLDPRTGPLINGVTGMTLLLESN